MNPEYSCPICGAKQILTFLNRKNVPVHQNLVLQDQGSAVKVVRGHLDLGFCRDCGFIFNKSFELSKLTYGEHYDNAQTHSPFFNEYIDKLVRCLVLEKSVRNCRIVEIGCGSGFFLRKLLEVGNGGNVGYGFDPSYVGPETDLGGRLKFEKRYYGRECAAIPADVVICRHVLEHVPDPLGLLETIRLALLNSPCARVFFETPCVEWILRNHVFWDLYYEHCSYFHTTSLITAFSITGFQVESVHHVFGGQYLWLEATIPSQKPTLTKNAGSLAQLAEHFALGEKELRKAWEIRIREASAQGKVAVWGAGAKGVTFVNLIDPHRKWITCVVDLNPNKQGHYIPGTGHPIVNYSDLVNYGVTTVILMNPNYHEENLTLLEKANMNMELMNLA